MDRVYQRRHYPVASSLVPDPQPSGARNFYDSWTSIVAKALGTFMPGMAMGYIRRRNALASYAAATLTGPNKAWRPSNKSADDIIRTDHKLLRARARSLVRDSTHVSGALRKICNNVVFQGIHPQATLAMFSGDRDKVSNARAEVAWKNWAEAIDLHEIENLVLRHLWQDGEIFAHYYFDPDLLDAGLIPLGIELLECDHLDVSYNGPDRDNRGIWKQGILFALNGRRRLGYQMFTEHPGDSTWLSNGRSRFFPAAHVDHLFIRERASQHRGVSWMAPVVIEMRDYGEFQGNERIAQRLMSAFGLFLKTEYPEHWASGNSPIGGDGKSITLDDVTDYIEPGRIQALPPGVEPFKVAYDRPGRTYEPFIKTSLRGSSTGFNMSYSSFSNDYTDSSYASERSATLEERRGYQVQQLLLASRLHYSAWRRMWMLNQLSRTIKNIPPVLPVTWQMPRWPWVDPDKDSKAAERDIKNGLNSRTRVCAERGANYDEVIADLKREEEDGFPIGGEVQEENNAGNQNE